MSATEIIEQLQSLPEADRCKVERWIRDQRVAAFDEMCALIDQADFPEKHLSEEELIALMSREKLR